MSVFFKFISWGGLCPRESPASVQSALCSQHPSSTCNFNGCWNTNQKEWMKRVALSFPFSKRPFKPFCCFCTMCTFPPLPHAKSTQKLLIFTSLPSHTPAKPPCILSVSVSLKCLLLVPVPIKLSKLIINSSF